MRCMEKLIFLLSKRVGRLIERRDYVSRLMNTKYFKAGALSTKQSVFYVVIVNVSKGAVLTSQKVTGRLMRIVIIVQNMLVIPICKWTKIFVT